MFSRFAHKLFYGINAIARQAGCDKVLIYRYFDNLDGLLQRVADNNDLWWTVDEIITENIKSGMNWESIVNLAMESGGHAYGRERVYSAKGW